MPSNPNGTGSPILLDVNWLTRVITVPQSYLTFVTGTLYSMDTDAFHFDMRELEASETGIVFVDSHAYTGAITVAGVTFAPFITLINNYTITFQSPNALGSPYHSVDGVGSPTILYAVRLDGSNNNIFDEGILNRNEVSVIPTNSAGLQIVSVGSGLDPTQSTQLEEIHGQARREIWVDETTATVGNGYQQTPYNSMSDALVDSSANNILRIHLEGSAAISDPQDISSITFFGQSMIGSEIVLSGAITNSGTQFHQTDVRGSITTSAAFEGCIIRDLTSEGIIATNCLIGGDLTLTGSPGTTGTTYLVDCRDGSSSIPSFDFAGATHTLNTKDYRGDLTLSGMSGGSVADISLLGGSVTIDSSCVGGTVTVYGTGELINNGTNVTVNEDRLITQAGGRGFGGM